MYRPLPVDGTLSPLCRFMDMKKYVGNMNKYAENKKKYVEIMEEYVGNMTKDVQNMKFLFIYPSYFFIALHVSSYSWDVEKFQASSSFE
mgnify:CR=1 FL=1